MFDKVVGLVSAICAAISGLAGLGAVYMASKQVDAAIEVVSRTEQTKYISDYVVAADDVCREIVPPALRDRIAYKERRNPDGTMARPGYVIEYRPDQGRIRLDESWKENATNLDKANNALSNKARLLVVWSTNGKSDHDLYTFSLQLVRRSLSDARAGTNTAPEMFINARALCEKWSDEAINQYMKSRG